MSETRICPVCENEIPEDAKFLCPHCHFELKWRDDESAIQDARQNFTGKLFTDKDNPELAGKSNESSQLEGSISIIGGVIFLGVAVNFLMWGLTDGTSPAGLILICGPGVVGLFLLIAGGKNLLK
jgi:hypothetical protein